MLAVPNDSVFCKRGHGLERVRAWQFCPSFICLLLLSCLAIWVPALEISVLPTWKLLASGRAVPPSIQFNPDLSLPCRRHWAGTGHVLSALVGLLGGQEALGNPSSFPLLELCSSFPEWLPDEVMRLADGRSCRENGSQWPPCLGDLPKAQNKPFWVAETETRLEIQTSLIS